MIHSMHWYIPRQQNHITKLLLEYGVSYVYSDFKSLYGLYEALKMHEAARGIKNRLI